MQGAIITPEVQEFLGGLLKYRWINSVYRFFCLVGNIIGFFLNGHAIVALGYWVVMVAGRISESALLFATLWITADNVASDFMAKSVAGKDNANTLTNLSILAFSLLPEVIVFSAIIITYEHWHAFFTDRRWLNPSWVWGILYTFPTGTFLTMTVFTLSSFVASGATPPQATGLALVVRCLAGWSYSIIGLIYSRIGKRSAVPSGHQNSTVQTPDFSQMLDQMRTQIQSELTTTLNTFRAELSAQIDTKIVQPEPLDYDEIAHKMLPVFGQFASSLHEEIVAQIPTVEPLDYDAITASIMPVIEAKLSTLEATLSAQIPVSIDVAELALQMATREVEGELSGGCEEGTIHPLEGELTGDVDEGTNTSPQKEVEGELDREPQGEVSNHDQVPLHIVPRRTKGGSERGNSTGNTRGNTEATKLIHRLLKKNSALGPTELAKNVGCSKRYASQVKREFLASQQVS